MTFLRDIYRWGFRVTWHNLRFNIGYRIGGFTHATTEPVDE